MKIADRLRKFFGIRTTTASATVAQRAPEAELVYWRSIWAQVFLAFVGGLNLAMGIVMHNWLNLGVAVLVLGCTVSSITTAYKGQWYAGYLAALNHVAPTEKVLQAKTEDDGSVCGCAENGDEAKVIFSSKIGMN